MALPQPLGEADPARHRLVQVDRRRLGVRRADLRDQAQVARVDHQEDRRDGLDGPARAEQRDVEIVAPPAGTHVVGGQPVGRGLELELGEVDRTPADVLVGDELELLEEGHEARDHDLAMDPPAAGRRRGRELLERLERDRPVGVRVVVGVDLVDVGLALVPLEPVHVVLDRLVDVDGALVDEDLGAEQVDLAEDPRPVRGRVDDHDVLRRGRAQRDLRGREVLARPVPAPVARLADMPLLGEEREQVVDRAGPEDLARLERQLERRRAQVGEQDVEVVRVEPGFLRRALEQELGVVDHVLVDRRAGGHEDRHARPLAPARPPELLPRGRDRARVAGQHGDVQPPDVDAQLQGVRGDDPEDLAVPQATFDGPPFGREVAAAIATDPAARPVVLAQRLAQAGQEDLHRGPRAAEHDRLAAGAQEGQRPALGERRRRSTGAALRMEDGRVDQQDVALAGRRAVAVDQLRRAARSGRWPARPGSRSSPSSTR